VLEGSRLLDRPNYTSAVFTASRLLPEPGLNPTTYTIPLRVNANILNIPPPETTIIPHIRRHAARVSQYQEGQETGSDRET
jgi:hypothetical protein